jgi:FAD/FMN-containing dehydrogenase
VILTRLARRLRGELLRPDDHGYDGARRGYNHLHDRRPAVIVRAADGDDVARALEFATGAGLQVKRRYDPTNVFHRNLNIRPSWSVRP